MRTYEDFEAQAVRDLAATGLGVAPRPKNEVDGVWGPDGVFYGWPAGDGPDGCLDDLPWPALGRWLGHLAAWIAYARHLVGVNNSIRVAAAAAGKRAAAEAWVRSRAGKVTDRRADVAADPVVAALEAVEEEAHRRDKLLTGRLGGLEQMYQAISREQARREGEHAEAGPIRRRP